MNSKLALIILLLFTSIMMNAQTKNEQNKRNVEELTFIVGMHCSACKDRIEKFIPMEKGVKDILVDLEKKEVTIFFKPQKTTPEKLKKAIEELGYSCKQKETI